MRSRYDRDTDEILMKYRYDGDTETDSDIGTNRAKREAICLHYFTDEVPIPIPIAVPIARSAKRIFFGLPARASQVTAPILLLREQY